MFRKPFKLKVFLKKLCALLVVICFAAGDLRLYADTSSINLAAPAAVPAIQKISENLIPPPSLPAAFVLPEEIGTVQETYRGSGPQTVLLIQDAHSQLEAQNSLQSLLKYAHEKYGFRMLFLEGGLEGPISPDLLRFYQNEAVNEQIAEKLLGKAAITGPGKFLLKNPEKMRAYGVEKIPATLETFKVTAVFIRPNRRAIYF